GHRAAYHLWLPLPRPWSGEGFAEAARRSGVAVSPASAFAIARGAVPDAVRVCLGAARGRGELEHGLRILGGLLAAAPEAAVMLEARPQIAAGKPPTAQLGPRTDGIKVGGSGVLQSLRGGTQYSVGELLYLMIALSDNTATNMLIGLVGTKDVDDRMAAY